MALAITNLCFSGKILLKEQVNSNRVCDAMQDLPWSNIWSAENPVEVLNETRGRMDHLAFLDYFSPFCFLLIEYHCHV